MKKLGIGLIGYGFIGKTHALAYASIPHIYNDLQHRPEIIGVATSHEDTARQAAADIGCSFCTSDWRELIDRDDIDIIDICSPNAAHKDQVIAALRAGKHIYCDKPLTATYDQTEEVLQAAEKSSSIHQMTFQNRFFPATIRARELIGAGKIGKPFHFRCSYLHAGYIDPNRPITWRMEKEQGGGALIDLGSHAIDLMNFLIGKISAVSAVTHTYIKERPVSKDSREMVPVEVDDYALLTVKTDSGIPGSIEASRFATGTSDELTFDIFGEQGGLRFNLMKPNWLYYFDASDPEGHFGGSQGYKRIESCQKYPEMRIRMTKNSIGWQDSHIHSAYHFLKAVAAGRPASPDLFDGAYVQQVVAAGYRSAEEHRWVDLDEIKSLVKS